MTVVRARERPPTADTAANGNGCKASDGTQQNGAQRGDVLRNGAHQNGGAHQDSEQPHLGFQEAGVGRVALLAALPAADIVVLTCTLNNATRSMVDSAFLDACRPGVRIVNVARGGLLEYDAVLQVRSSRTQIHVNIHECRHRRPRRLAMACWTIRRCCRCVHHSLIALEHSIGS